MRGGETASLRCVQAADLAWCQQPIWCALKPKRPLPLLPVHRHPMSRPGRAQHFDLRIRHGRDLRRAQAIHFVGAQWRNLRYVQSGYSRRRQIVNPSDRVHLIRTERVDLRARKARGPRAVQIAQRIVYEPSGCSRCDRGNLRCRHHPHRARTGDPSKAGDLCRRKLCALRRRQTSDVRLRQLSNMRLRQILNLCSIDAADLGTILHRKIEPGHLRVGKFLNLRYGDNVADRADLRRRKGRNAARTVR